MTVMGARQFQHKFGKRGICMPRCMFIKTGPWANLGVLMAKVPPRGIAQTSSTTHAGSG